MSNIRQMKIYSALHMMVFYDSCLELTYDKLLQSLGLWGKRGCSRVVGEKKMLYVKF